MKIYFDESVFENGFSLRAFSTLIVSNRADAYLGERLKKRVIVAKTCADESDTDAVNVNARVPCRGINVYTMDASSKRLLRSAGYKQIVVLTTYDTDNARPLHIGEHIGEPYVYDINSDLTSLESAIMLKYYAVSTSMDEARPVFVTRTLYRYAREKFVDTRAWFRFDDDDEGFDDDDDYVSGLVAALSGPSIEPWY